MDPVEPHQAPEGLSLSVCLGALTGLLVGVIVAMLGAAGLHHGFPQSGSAEVFWEIAAPLLGILGLVVGSSLAHRLLSDRLWLALVLFGAMLGLGLVLAFWLVGFPFRSA